MRWEERASVSLGVSGFAGILTPGGDHPVTGAYNRQKTKMPGTLKNEGVRANHRRTTSTPAAGANEAVQGDDVIASISILNCTGIDYVRTPIIKDTFNSN
ncbi:hypothetical protein EVAR_42947_1 [Eumeta japonica]|uniref:Uncharacterized protein n=1 Tax=Eumeta variegata TaxID=151549 RepID=A0A4C1YHF4_EUMVA|nr:hypothetical protein EVAR_42947_1 [Eumeta japonica]